MGKRKKVQKQKQLKDTEFYFDDCPVCRAMKQVEKEGRELSEAELKFAFNEAKVQGAMVGGKLVEDEQGVPH